LIQVYEMATDLFGNNEKAKRWLKKPARGLGGRTPLEYADTYIGANEVIKLLGRIDHGIFPGSKLPPGVFHLKNIVIRRLSAKALKFGGERLNAKNWPIE